MKTQKKLYIFGCILDVWIIILGCLGTYIEISENTFAMLAYYTTDSNILMAAACVLDLYYQIRAGKGSIAPKWVKTVKYLGVCCMAVTFLVVFFVLAPMGGMDGYCRMFFKGALKYQHFLCPVLALAGFFMVDVKQEQLSLSVVKLAMLPTVCYAVLSTVGNLAKIMYGPYPFLHVYEQPVYMSVLWCVIILGIAYGIAWGLWRISRKLYCNFES